MPLDRRSIVWGLMLSIAATGLYDALKSAMEGKIHEEIIGVIAIVVVDLFLFVIFHKELSKKE